MLRKLMLSAVVGGLLLVATKEASAQVIIPGPFGQTNVIMPGRLNPLANIPLGPVQPYTYFQPGVGWVTGYRYIGLDGLPHGQINIPNPVGGNTTIFHYNRTPVRVPHPHVHRHHHIR